MFDLRILRPAALLFLLLAVPSTAPAAVAAYDFAAVQAGLDRACDDGMFSGVVLVRARGEDVFERTCGEADIVNRVPMTRETRFKIYSTSKLVTALAVMKLVEDGRLSLDASIRGYLPDSPAEWAPVTVRQLLNHTSGIADLTEALLPHFRSDHSTAMRELLQALTPGQKQLQSSPGKVFRYSNYGFELLAEAAARVADQPFADLVDALVFQPAGMETASIERPNLIAGHAVTVNEDGLAKGYNGVPEKLDQSNNWAFMQQGAGAVRVSAIDLIALDTALDAGTIISPATFREMTRDPGDGRSAAEGAAYKLGIVTREVDGVRTQGHDGGNNGYIADFQRFPDDDAVLVVLSNRGFTETTWLFKEVRTALKAAR